MLNLLLLMFALIHLGLLYWSFLWPQPHSWRVWFLRLMLFAMIYDNSLVAVGNWCIESSWYYAANYPRFILHAGVLPFLSLFALSAMKVSGVQIAHSRALQIFTYLFITGALSYGVHEVVYLELGPKPVLGVAKLASLSGLPPIATILTNLLILPMAAAVWRVGKWPWFFLGSLFIFVWNGAMGAQPWGFIAGNFGEVVFILALLRTELFLKKKNGALTPS